MRKQNQSIRSFLVTVLVAVGLAVAFLPGCGDDTVDDNGYDSDSDSGFDSDSGMDSAPS